MPSAIRWARSVGGLGGSRPGLDAVAANFLPVLDTASHPSGSTPRRAGRPPRNRMSATKRWPAAANLRRRQLAARLNEVGMSGGYFHIVLRLVETGSRPTVQRCTDESLTRSFPPGGQR